MKKLVVGIAAMMIGMTQVFAAEYKVGLVDVQKALRTVDEGKRAQSTLEKEAGKKKAKLEKEGADIKKAVEELQKQSMALKDDVRRKREMEIQERAAKFQEMQVMEQRDLQRQELELTKPILEKIKKLTDDLAKKKGYSLVMDKNEGIILFSLDQDDLTQEVINTYNKNNKKPTT